MRKVTKSMRMIAVILAFAMIFQNTFSVLATVDGDAPVVTAEDVSAEAVTPTPTETPDLASETLQENASVSKSSEPETVEAVSAEEDSSAVLTDEAEQEDEKEVSEETEASGEKKIDEGSTAADNMDVSNGNASDEQVPETIQELPEDPQNETRDTQEPAEESEVTEALAGEENTPDIEEPAVEELEVEKSAPKKAKEISTDLSSYLENAELLIDGEVQDGTWDVKENQSYEVKLSFAENNGKPFNKVADSLTFSLPDGFRVPDNFASSLDIAVEDDGITYNVAANQYTVSGNTVTFTWNKASENWQHLTDATNAEFHMVLSGTFDASQSETITFGGITKNIRVDSDTDLEIEKTGTYNSAENRIDYKVTVKSVGVNKNVVVEDTISGTALTYNNDLKLNGESVSSESDESGSFNGFKYTIPQLNHDETAEFTYSARLDMSEITDKGTVEQTGNAVKVNSDTVDEKSAEKNFANEITFTPSVKKTGEAEEGSNDQKTVTWTVIVNDKFDGSMAGQTITDSIVEESRSIMRYSGSGIKVVVTDKQGNIIRTDNNIGWNSESLAKTDSTWIYTVPETDTGYYQYTITYTTEVDVTGKTADTEVKNEVGAGGGKGTGSVSVGPGSSKTELEKTATEVTADTVTWTITFTVPEPGLTKAVVTDTYPAKWDEYKDTLSKDGITISNLLEGEDFTLDTADPEKAVITFYYVENGITYEGLKGGNEERTITITVVTDNNKKWMQDMPAGTSNSTHVNNVSLNANGQVLTAFAEAEPAETRVEKSADSSVKIITINGKQYPVFKFTVRLYGVNSDEFFVGDSFDERLEFYDITGKSGDLLPEGANLWWDQHVHNGYQTSMHMDQAVVYDSEQGGFQITAEMLPKNEGKYYDLYSFSYYLKVKDDKLNDFMNQAVEKVTVSNTATFGTGSSSVNVDYTYDNLTKKILTDQNALNNPSVQNVEYQIIANPSGLDLDPESDTLTLVDTFDNLAVDYATIVSEPEIEKIMFDGNTIRFTIPDSQKVVITYTARIIRSGNISNTAELLNNKKTQESNANVNTSGSGTASIPSIRVLKIDEDNNAVKLSGAKFQLFNEDKSEFIDDKGNPVIITTGEDGIALLRLSSTVNGMTLEYDTKYILKEIKAPEGYEKNTIEYEFRINKQGLSDYSNYVYVSGDILTVKDKQGETTIDIPVEKKWEGDNQNQRPESITIQLQQTEGAVTETAAYSDVSGKTLELNAENEWKGSFTDLPVKTESGEEIHYTLKEIEVKGYTSEVAGDEENGFVVTNTKKEAGSLSLKKLTAGNAVPEDASFQFNIQLSDAKFSDTVPVRVTDLDANTVSDSITSLRFSDGAASVTLGSNQIITIQGLPADVTATITENESAKNAGYKIEVLETTDAGDVYTETSSADADIISGENVSVTFKNTRNKNGSLEITKKLDGASADPDQEFTFLVTFADLGSSAPEKISVNYSNGKSEEVDLSSPISITLKGGETATLDQLPNGASYTVTEDNSSLGSYDPTTDAGKANGYVASVTNTTGTVNAQNTGASGTIDYENLSKVEVTNTRNLYGGLTLDKNVTGNDKNKKKWFEFTIVLQGDAISGTQKFGDVTFINGVSQSNFAVLKNGEKTLYYRDSDGLKPVPVNSYTAEREGYFLISSETGVILTGIPAGTSYSIAEADYSDTYSEKTEMRVTGTIEAIAESPKGVTENKIPEINRAIVTNNRDKYSTLRIDKDLAVDGKGTKIDLDDKAREFGIEICMWDENGEPIDKTFESAGAVSQVEFINGVADITLKGSEDVKITNVPKFYTYTVKEYVKTGDTKTYLAAGEILESGDDRYQVSYQDTYKDTEKAVDYIREDGTAEIGDQQHYVVITNTKQTLYGGLMVTKRVFTDAEHANKKFEFTVKLYAAQGTLADYKMTYDADGVSNSAPFEWNADKNVYEAAFELGNNESAYVLNIPDGTSYEVKEKADQDYVTESENAKGKIIGTSAQGTVVVNDIESSNKSRFTNTYSAGKLTLSKTVAGNSGNKDEEFTFKIYLTKTPEGQNSIRVNVSKNGNPAEPKTVTFDSEGVGTLECNLKHGDIVVLDDIPAGIQYKVEETDSKGYVQAPENDSDPLKGTIETDKVSAVSITNTLEKFSGLSITKQIAGNAAKVNRDYSFTLTVRDDTVTSATLMIRDAKGVETTSKSISFTDGVSEKFKMKGNCTAVISGLPVGTEYVVNEVDTPSEYSASYSDNQTGTIEDGNTPSVIVTNTRNEYGTLTVTKYLEGNDIDVSKTFDFVVELTRGDGVQDTVAGKLDGREYKFASDGKVTVPIEGVTVNGSKVITDIPNGTSYTVTESSGSAAGYTTEASVINSDKVTAEVSDDNKSVTGFIDINKKIGDNDAGSANLTHALIFTNRKDTYGGIRITKKVAGNSKDQIIGPFKFKVSFDVNQDGVYEDTQTVSVNNAEEAVSVLLLSDKTSSIPNGTPYKVEEDIPADKAYTAGYVNAQGTVKGVEGITEDLIPDQNQVEVTNTLDTSGTLAITKTMSGNTQDASQQFVFQITAENDAAREVNGTRNVVIKNKETGAVIENRTIRFTNGNSSVQITKDQKAEISDLPNAASFKIKEDSTGKNYTTTYNGEATDGTKVSISGNAVTPVIINNELDTFGSLSLKKEVKGDFIDANAQFSFTITLDGLLDDSKEHGSLPFAEVNGNSVATFTLKNGNTAVVTNLPNGMQYTITENLTDTQQKLYTSSCPATGIVGNITGNQTVYETVTNTSGYDSVPASIMTKKSYVDADGKELIQEDREFTFTLEPVGDAPMPEDKNSIDVSRNMKDVRDAFELASVSYDSVGDYEYTITEKVPNGYTEGLVSSDGIIYDVRTVHVLVRVTSKRENNQIVGLQASVYYDDGSSVVAFKNVKTSTKVSKVDVEGTRIGGAKFRIEDKNGTVVVPEWTSSENAPYEVNNLSTEVEYYLVETGAPEGYAYTDKLLFKISSDGKVLDEEGGRFTDDTILVEDAKLKFNVNKLDATSEKEVEGAEIVIYDSEGKEVDRWTSKEDETHDFGDKLQAGGTYTLVETGVPTGYDYITEIDFTVNKDGTIELVENDDVRYNEDTDTWEILDEALKFNVNKLDAGNGKEVEGAVIVIYDSEGKEVDRWTSKEEETHDFGEKLEAGETYTLVEDGAPAGYAYINTIELTVGKDGSVDIESDDIRYNKDTDTWEILDEALKFNVNKLDAGNGKEVEGAVIVIYDSEGNEVDRWTSKEEETHDFGEKLEAGKKYTLVEDGTPAGYAYINTIELTVGKDGSVDIESDDIRYNKDTDTWEILDEALKFNVNKLDAGNGKEVEGAVIVIYDSEGNEVDRWTSKEKETHDFGEKLEAGKKYTLVEDGAPAGYAYINTIELTVGKDGSVDIESDDIRYNKDTDTWEILDESLKVSINKTDITGDKEVPGATIEIRELETGKLIETWVSDAKGPHDIGDKLEAGKTYVLKETGAPDGYAYTTDVIFSITKDGKVLDENGKEVPEGTVLVKDEELADCKGSISVTKKIALLDGFDFIDLYASSATYYLRLYSDENGVHAYGPQKPVTIKNGSSGTVTWENLPNGTYWVFETTEDGELLPMSMGHFDTERNAFYSCIVDGDTNKVEIDLETAQVAGAVNLVNAYTTIPDGFAYQGSVRIQKKVMDGDEVYDTDEEFYAGIFSDPDQETADAFEGVPMVVKLNNNGEAVSITVPVNADKSATIYYVYETDENGKRIDMTKRGYTVTGEGSVELSREMGVDGTITLTNTLIEEVETPTATPTPTPTATATPTATPTVTATPTNAPRTGDISNLEWYLALLAAALFTTFGTAAYKKKRQN